MSEPCTATNSITLAQGGEEIEFVCDQPRGHDLLPRGRVSNLYRAGPCDRCGEPGRRFINAHLCDLHAPNPPQPVYERSLAGLREAAGIVPPPIVERRPARHTPAARAADAASSLDVSLGSITPQGRDALWACGLCTVQGLTSPSAAPLALAAHLKYRHPNRAAKVAERAVEAPAAPVGLDHPMTSIRAAAAKLPRSGSQRRAIYDLIVKAGAPGMTDAELETATGGLHQSVSASRNSLMKDGLIADSGRRRDTPSGQEAICWIAT